MEEESFENSDIADYLNKHFISIKVDREERPDVDAVYMSVCQEMTGQGGWPLTILMTPDCKPFYAATYLPPKEKYGMHGLNELLRAITEQWTKNRDKLLDAGNQIQKALIEQSKANPWEEPKKEILHQAYSQFERMYDKNNGGFGSAPKFPTPHNLLFLMEYAKNERNKKALHMVETTLTQMFRGGIYDHIGGGFSRYSTDSEWLVPHFEKMLYDNALLILAYLEAYLFSGEKMYSAVVRRVLDYVLCELTQEDGGFYCGQDADSDGVEGKYYVFTPEELVEVLGQDAKTFCKWYGITKNGNFEGKNIPNLLDNEEYSSSVEKINALSKRVYQYRLKRTRLHRDNKILLSWNSWMILAFARAYAVTDQEEYLHTAIRAEQFISRHLTKKSQLFVRYCDGETAGEGKLDDYAFYTYALLELYAVSFDIGYLQKAVRYADRMIEGFFDETNGGFYLYAKDGEQLIVRPKETYDGAIPSGNSVAACVLEKLAKLTAEMKWQTALEKQMHFLCGVAKDYPSGYSFALIAIQRVLYPSKELICLSPSEEDIKRLRAMALRDKSLCILVITNENQKELTELAQFVKNYDIPTKGSRFFLCIGNSCYTPVNRLEEIEIYCKT